MKIQISSRFVSCFGLAAIAATLSLASNGFAETKNKISWGCKNPPQTASTACWDEGRREFESAGCDIAPGKCDAPLVKNKRGVKHRDASRWICDSVSVLCAAIGFNPISGDPSCNAHPGFHRKSINGNVASDVCLNDHDSPVSAPPAQPAAAFPPVDSAK